MIIFIQETTKPNKGLGNFLRVPKLWLYEEFSYITIQHSIKLLKLKTTPKFGMKLYLKRLFSGKLNVWTEYPKFR